MNLTTPDTVSSTFKRLKLQRGFGVLSIAAITYHYSLMISTQWNNAAAPGQRKRSDVRHHGKGAGRVNGRAARLMREKRPF
jgi:hypothetical protein